MKTNQKLSEQPAQLTIANRPLARQVREARRIVGIWEDHRRVANMPVGQVLQQARAFELARIDAISNI